MPRGIPKNGRPLRLKPETVVISEKIRERNAIYTLTMLGYVVMFLGKPIPVTCRNPQCRTHQWAKTTGNSPGVSDLIVTHPTYWPSKTWKMLETKRTGGDRREEQIKLVEAGLSTFYVTEEEAVRAVIETERLMGLAPNPRLLRYLQMNVKGQWATESALPLG